MVTGPAAARTPPMTSAPPMEGVAIKNAPPLKAAPPIKSAPPTNSVGVNVVEASVAMQAKAKVANIVKLGCARYMGCMGSLLCCRS